PAFLPFPTARLDPERYYANLQGLLKHTQPRAVMTYPELREALQQVELPPDKRPAVLVQEDAVPQPMYDEPASHDAEDVALIQFSSGSTGLQKGAVLSHRAILAEIQGVGEFFELTDRDSILSWVPLYHDWGLVCVALHALQLGTHYTLLSPMHWVMRPAVVFEATHAYRPTVYYHPNFAFNYMTQRVKDEEMEGLDLSSLRICCNGAEPCFYDSHKMFTDRFAPWGLQPESLSIVYGMAEVTNSVFAAGHNEPIQVDGIDRKVLQEEHRAQPVSAVDPNVMRILGVGRALTGTRFTIFDNNRNELAERSVGEVAIKSRAKFHGYYRNPEATAQTQHEGWYLTGDLGYRVGDILYITGRKSDLIIAGGVNIYPQDVENIVAEHAAVVAGRVAAIGVPDVDLGTERLVVIAESRATEPAVLRDIAHHVRSQVRQRLGVVVDRIYHAPYRWLIKTSSGKIARVPNYERLPELDSRVG
ncbi:MAG: AMP-binding protein, partial [Candidatus Tectomicrobia bacterium]|nr:AMP-binding protein [Candidatus Tectomicrobia bacterium]